MRSLPQVLLFLFAAVVLAPQVFGQPSKGDKTLSLGITEFRTEDATRSISDSEGDNRQDIQENDYSKIGVGGSGGYMLTDRLEAGIGFAAWKSSSKTRRFQNDEIWENRYSELSSDAYGKFHFKIENSRIVPFMKGGGGLSRMFTIINSGIGYLDEDNEIKARTTEWNIFGAGGIDFYVSEHFAVTASVTMEWSFDSHDMDVDSEDSSIFKKNRKALRFGFGVASYF